MNKPFTVTLPVAQNEILSTVLAIDMEIADHQHEVAKLKKLMEAVRHCCSHPKQEEIYYIPEDFPVRKYQCLVCGMKL